MVSETIWQCFPENGCCNGEGSKTITFLSDIAHGLSSFLSLIFTIIIKTWSWWFLVHNIFMLGTQLSPMQTDAQHCWMLHVASICTPCCMHVVRSCRAKFETGQTFEPKTSNISFAPWSLKSSATMLDLFALLFPTLLGLRTHITNGLQSLMSCILPMMYCWEFLHPFTHHCQNGCNNSQYCWPNSVGELLHPFASNFRERRV